MFPVKDYPLRGPLWYIIDKERLKFAPASASVTNRTQAGQNRLPRQKGWDPMKNAALSALCNEWFTQTSRSDWDNATIDEIKDALETLKQNRPAIVKFTAEEIWAEMQDIIAEYDQANKPD